MSHAALSPSLPPAARAPAPQSRQLRLDFAIRRDGAEIGSERVVVERAGETEVVRTRTEAVVRLAFVTVHRFTHSATETWRAGRLEGLQARTDDNGVLHYLSVARAGRRLIVAADGRRSEVPFGILPASLWSDRIAGQATLLDTREGRLLAVAAAPRARSWERPLPTLRLTLGDGRERELWYDDAGLLRCQRFIARDGAEIVVERRS